FMNPFGKARFLLVGRKEDEGLRRMCEPGRMLWTNVEVSTSLRREYGQIGKALMPAMAARPAPSMARDAFLL
ncbi:MAG TPA: hypothetical protein DCS68_09185, partial [Pantoea agglomerans]|nr:hypothetical protein [Pantoea agglomerans]